MMNKQAIRTDFIYIFLILVFSVLLFGILFGFNRIFGEPLDFQVHATYYVVTSAFIIELFFFTITFVVFLIRQLINRFKSKSGNIILIASAILLGLMIFMIWNNYISAENSQMI